MLRAEPSKSLSQSNQSKASRKEAVKAEVILCSLGRRFSGVTSTLLQVLPHQEDEVPIVVFGKLNRNGKAPAIGLRDLLQVTRRNLEDGSYRVFHARRNIEMLWGLILKNVFNRRLKLLFTSTAQRHHTLYTRLLYNRMDALVTTSDRAGSFLRRKADYVIPHGIDLESFRFVSDKRKAWEQIGFPGKKGVGLFGRVRPQKGVGFFVDAMLEALPKVPEYTAVIAGRTTPSHKKFVRRTQQKIRDAGMEDRFVWLDEVPLDRVAELYGAMSLQCSIPTVEGFGLTCLEAMSSGTPVIASKTGAFDYIIRDGIEGKLVPCGDSHAVANAFLEIATDEDRLTEMAKASRRRVETSFRIQQEASRLLEVYRDLRR